MDLAAHWNAVYTTKDPDRLSWYQADPTPTVERLRPMLRPGAHVVDVGAGASLLVDRLLDETGVHVTLVDLSHSALEQVRGRLGARAARVDTVATDLCTWTPARRFDAWHDRAVFHFLTTPERQAAYRRVLLRSTAPGALVLVAAFHATGPEQCSQLPTARYDADSLHEALGGEALERVWDEVIDHVRPDGRLQAFQHVLLRRLTAPE